MKIVLVGESVPEGWAQSFKRAFGSLGHEAAIVDDWRIYRYSSPLARNRYAHRIIWRILAVFAQAKMLSAVLEEHPDMVIIFKGWLWRPDTLRAIKAALPKTILVNYNPDSPFNREAHGNANNWIRESIPIFDMYLIWSKELTERLKSMGARNPHYLPCSYDPELHHPMAISEKDREIFGSDVAFVGSWDREREEWMRGLLGYDLKIWGNSWEKAGPDVRSRWQGRAAVMEDFSKVCASAKIVLNLLRPQNKSAHNMRTFEVPASKGFMLAERSLEQQEFFGEGAEAEYFSTPGELGRKIDMYLRLPEERSRMAEAAYSRLLREHHSYRDRAEKMIEWSKEISR